MTTWMRPREKTGRDTWACRLVGGSQNPHDPITAKPARAVNAPLGLPALMMVRLRYAYVCRCRGRIPARRVVVRSDVRRADAKARRRSAAAGGAGLDFGLLSPRHDRRLSDEQAGRAGDAADTCRHRRGDRARRKRV